MILHIAGTGCPDPAPDRYGSCFVLETADCRLMFDCGPAATYKLARMGIRSTTIDRLFLTHHHFDHNADCPCFLLTRWDQDNGTLPPLRIYGPPPTESFVERLIGERGAFFEDWKARIEHPASHACHQMRKGTLPRPPPAFGVQNIEQGIVEETENWTVTAVPVHHVEPWLTSLAFRADTKEGSVVYTGDAGPCPSLTQLAQGADVLVICSVYTGSMEPRVADVCTSASDAGQIAAECGVKTVVLTHTTPGIASPGRREAAVAEVARFFSGRIVFADELVSLPIP